ncbi:LysR family transcriptional regulator [Loktanella sp. S4079]|uniref:LysR family transcriptional regulator n=1 Tax=Loktanella sp. S4079 TaxID=579483 RepID=UPI0005F9B69C|nr:LysR family transcriptional regulator [Loktanella sp. S4079]KJZ18582.1 LysR family transcriptional regulator [Loktanella sp. S4079]
MKRDDFADLTVFVAVAEEGSFTQAAVRLGVSQSAVSHTIRRLEASLGFRLLNRTSRSVSTTEMGEKLLATLRPGLSQIETRIEELRSLGDSPSGMIRLTTSMTAARQVLWPVMTRLVSDYPDIQIDLNTNARLADLAEGRYDGAIRLAEAVPADLISVPVGPPIEMAAIGSPSYFAKKGVPQTPADLDSHDCITMRFGVGTTPYDWEFEKDGVELVKRVTGPFIFSEGDLCVDAARAGYGIAFVTLPEVQAEIATGTLQRVLADWCPPFEGLHLCYLSRRQMSPAFRVLIDRLRDQYQRTLAK